MDVYDHGYIPDDAECNQDTVRYALDCAEGFYADSLRQSEEEIRSLKEQLAKANERSRKLEYLVIRFRQGVTHFNRSRGDTNKLFSAYTDSEQLRKEQE